MNRQYKEDNQYKYFVSIFNDSYELWMWEEDLNYSERKFFYDLMLDAQNEIEKIKNIYNL
jgi:hypothetical protein